MAAPLLGLASILGREYAYSQPTYAGQDAMLKLLSPQTYFTNQLINYLTDKFNIDSDLPRAQNTGERAARVLYGVGPKGLSQEEYDTQMAESSARVNAPGSVEKFENYLRELDYTTIPPDARNFTGPHAEDSSVFQYGVDSFPITVGQLPVQSNFTPEELLFLERHLLDKSFNVGPQLEGPDIPRSPDFMPQGGSGGIDVGGAGGDFMPQGGSGFAPQSGGKDDFNIQAEYEQYLRGGLIQRRR